MATFTSNGQTWEFTPPPVRKNPNRGWLVALLVLSCCLLSFAAGAIGSVVAYRAMSDAEREEVTTTAPQAQQTPSEKPQDNCQINQNQDQNQDQTPTTPPVQEQPSQDPSTEDFPSAGESELASIAEVAAKVSASVVEIHVETTSGSSRGSGVIISADGRILTCHHVVSGAKSITVRLNNGVELNAKLIAGDSQSDLAVVSVTLSSDEHLPYASYGNSAELVVGERVIAIGNPLGTLGGTVTDGIISATQRKIVGSDGNVMTLLQTNAAINQGNSGGGLFNMSGELIGIVNSKYAATGVEGLAFAIPSDYAADIESDLVTYGYVRGRVDTGLELVDVVISDWYSQYYYAQFGIYESGLYVISSAYSTDLKNADRIVSVNDVTVNSEAEFDEVIRALAVGDTITITATRGRDAAFTVSIALQEYKPVNS